VAVSVTWDSIDKKIVRLVFEGRWTWDELYNANQQTKIMLDEVSHDVGVLVDLQNSSYGVPPGFFPNLKVLLAGRSSAVRVTALVGINAQFRALWGVFIRVYGLVIKDRIYRFVASADEGKALIYEHLEVVQSRP
jgi:hypothetical protein